MKFLKPAREGVLNVRSEDFRSAVLMTPHCCVGTYKEHLMKTNVNSARRGLPLNTKKTNIMVINN